MSWLIYWSACGILLFILAYLKIERHQDEETLNNIESFAWQFGTSIEFIEQLIYLLCLMLGGILLPLVFINKVHKLCTGKDMF